MVSKSIDNLTNLVKMKSGLTEAILLPFLTNYELIQISQLNHTWQKKFDPNYAGAHFNLVKCLMDRMHTKTDEAAQEM